MQPIMAEGKRLVIPFTRYWFSTRKKANAMSLEGGYRVVIVYDSKRKDWLLLVKLAVIDAGGGR